MLSLYCLHHFFLTLYVNFTIEPHSENVTACNVHPYNSPTVCAEMNFYPLGIRLFCSKKQFV